VVTITDANGCFATTVPVTITEPPLLTTTTSNTTNYNTFGVSCGDIVTGPDNDGGIDATPTGGTPTYTYLWTTGTGVIPAGQETAQSPTGLTAGTYDVLVTDANGCTVTDQIVVTEPVILTLDNLDPSIYAGGFNLSGCFPDGTITTTMSGGVTPYTYAWTGPNGFTSTDGNLTTLAAGTYTLVATDANGCEVTGTIILTEPSGLDISGTSFVYPSGTNISCFGASDGSIDMTTVGGAGPYIYSWTDGSGFTASTEDIGSVPAGTYTLTVTDDNGCVVDTIITLTEPPVLLVTSSVTTDYNGFGISCFGLSDGGLGSTPTGGSGLVATDYVYSWDTNPATGVVSTDQNPTGLAAGDYTVTVTDINGCTATSDVTIIEPTVVTSASSVTSDYNGFGVSCFGSSDGSLGSTPGGGVTTLPYTFEWNTDPLTTVVSTDQNPSGLPTGSYTVTITDANGCTSTTVPVLITEPTVVTSASLVSSDYNGFGVSCFGSSDGSLGSTPGGGVITLPYTFEWNTDPATTVVSTDQNPTGLPTGSYTVTITDANGCTSTTVPVLITEPTVVTAASLVSSDYNGFGVSCFGASDGSLGSTPGGGTTTLPYTFAWDTDPTSGGTISTAQNPSGLPAGDYVVTITDANGCFATTVPVTITEPPLLTTTTSNTTDYNTFGVSCGDIVTGPDNDGGIDATPSGGTPTYTYLWTTGTGVIPAGQETAQSPTGLTAGTYDVLVTDANGCTVTDQIVVTEPVILTLDNLDPSIYAGGFNLSGCFPDGTITTTMSGGVTPYTYAWTGPNGFTSTDGNLTTLAAGTYTLVATDANGCEVTGTIILTEPSGLDISGTSFVYPSGTNISCFGASDGSIDMTTVGGAGPYTYSWTDGAGFTASTEDIGSVPAGTYTLTVTDDNGCVVDTIITLTEPPVLLVTSSVTTDYNGFGISCFGLSDGGLGSTPTGGSGLVATDYVYSWDTNPATGVVSTDQNPTGLAAGDYTVTVTDINGCTATSDVTIIEPTVVTSASTVTSDYNGFGVSCFGASDGSLGSTPGGGVTTLPYTFEWNTDPLTTVVSTDQNPSGLPTGSYTVTITDANGCTSTTVPVLITEPTVVTSASLVSSDYNGFGVSCFGSSDGSLGSTPGGGVITLPYTFEWNTDPLTTVVSTDQNPSGLPTGSYTVTITDANGCTSTTVPVLITEPTVVTAASLVSSDYNGFGVSCFGASDGSLGSTPGGGTTTLPYTFAWDTDPTSGGTISTAQNPSGLPAGDYVVTITDANGCFATTVPVTITEPPLLTTTTSNTTDYNTFGVSCGDIVTGPDNDGGIDATPSGGTPTYTYLWTTGTGVIPAGQETAQSPTGLTAGTYDVLVTDANGCTVTDQIVVTEPVILTLDNLDPSIYAGGFNLSGCFPDGTITTTMSGGVTPYTYAWTGPNGFTSTDGNLTTLAAGTYTLVATDANGCEVTGTIILTEPSGLDISGTSFVYPSGTNISCFGTSDGSIDMTTVGGAGPYTYSWTDGAGFTASTEDIGSVPAGTYTLTVTDDNGCVVDTIITLVEPVSLDQVITSPTFASGDNISCFGFNDGSIDYTVSGGSPDYTYVWTTVDGSGLTAGMEDQSGLTVGTYTVTVTDINGCVITTNIILTEPTVLTQNISAGTYPSGDNISCFGFNDGSIDYTVSGGSPDYTYEWSTIDGSGIVLTNEDQTGLIVGTYNVTATDINGCEITTSITLIEPTPLVQTGNPFVYPSGDNISCFGLSDGSIDYTVTGGSPDYDYSWSNGVITQDINGVQMGTYTVIVTDINGCVIDTTISLVEPAPLDQLSTLSVYPSGDNISCFEFNDGSIDYVPSGGSPGYTYVWSTTDGSGITQGQEDQTNLTAGTYQVVMTDINGCQQTTTITLIEPTPLTIGLTPSIYAGGFNLSGCAPDGSIDATVGGGSPGYIYSWSPTSQVSEDITDLPAGTYTVTVTDINGCIITEEITLVQPPIVTVTTAVTSNYNGQQISCTGFSDGSVTSSPNGGATPYTYQWTDELGVLGVLGVNQSLTGQPQGTYVVLVTDANGCTATEVITLVDPPAIDASGVVSTNYNGQDVTCFGATDGAIDLTVNGGTPGYNYNWVNQNGAFVSSMQDPIGVGAGTYTVTITDLNGCVFTTDVVVTEPEPMNSEAVVITDYNGQNVSCYESTDGGIQGNATGGTPGYSYIWTFGGTQVGTDQTVSNVGAGNYTVNISDLNGCLTTAVVTVTQPSPLIANTTILSNYFGAPVSCTGAEDGIASVSYLGGTPVYAVSWNTNPPQTTDQVNNFPEGTWTATITDINGCVTTADIVMWANPLPDFTAPESVIGCIGSPLIIDANAEPGTNCEWTFSDGTVINECGPFEMTFSELSCFDMQLVISTPQGCRDTVSTADFICVAPNPVAAFTISEYDLYTTDYDAYFYNVSEGADAYYWDFGDGTNSTEVNPYHQFPTEGYEFFEIWLTAISEYGCLDSTVRYIRFHPELIYYVPNSFTPDGDDYNNVFKPVISSGYSLDNFNFMIFNRWGELIYESNDITTVGWDGTYRGSKCQEGVYIWKMAIMNSDTDRKEEAVGHVTLLRGAGLK
jgi:large repetitive protein